MELQTENAWIDGYEGRQTDRQTHTSIGLTEEIRQIKRHGPVASSQEIDFAKEYSSHAEQEQ